MQQHDSSQNVDDGDVVDLAPILLGGDRDHELGRLGEERPAVRARYLDGSTVWLVTRYQDILTVLTDQRFSNDPTKQTGFDLAAVAGFPADVQPYMLHTLGAYDPPDHTRLRRLVSRAFTAKRVQHLRPHIQQITDELVEAMTHAGAVGGEVDLLEHLGYPLPIRVICELLGVPPGDQNRFRVWADGLISRDPDQIAAGARSLIGYVSDLLEAKRATPADDLLSALVGVHDEDGDRLSQEELVSVSITLLLAGYETTVSLLGNGTVLLLTNPDQLRRLRTDPARVPAAVEELVRLAGPADVAPFRYTLAEVTLSGVTIPAGATVLVAYAAANRDPRRFPDPTHLDVTRTDNKHLGFGHGIHYCLGAPLARLEATVAFTKLLARFPDLALAVSADQLPWRLGPDRHVKRVPVRLGTPAQPTKAATSR